MGPLPANRKHWRKVRVIRRFAHYMVQSNEHAECPNVVCCEHTVICQPCTLLRGLIKHSLCPNNPFVIWLRYHVHYSLMRLAAKASRDRAGSCREIFASLFLEFAIHKPMDLVHGKAISWEILQLNPSVFATSSKDVHVKQGYDVSSGVPLCISPFSLFKTRPSPDQFLRKRWADRSNNGSLEERGEGDVKPNAIPPAWHT